MDRKPSLCWWFYRLTDGLKLHNSRMCRYGPELSWAIFGLPGNIYCSGLCLTWLSMHRKIFELPSKENNQLQLAPVPEMLSNDMSPMAEIFFYTFNASVLCSYNVSFKALLNDFLMVYYYKHLCNHILVRKWYFRQPESIFLDHNHVICLTINFLLKRW